jgi:hypothetical protein
MYLIQVGRRRLNLEYVIMDEEGDGDDIPAGVVRVTMLRGRQFELSGSEADLYRRHIGGLLAPEPGAVSGGRSGAVAQVIDPRSGVRLPDPGQEGKESG